MPAGLLSSLDLTGAVEEESAWVPDVMPVQLIDRAVSGHTAEVAAYISNIAAGGLDIRRAEIVNASKWRRGKRPVGIIPFVERVLYRSVVKSLQSELPPLVRGRDAFNDFQLQPVIHGSPYVVVTDLANFYTSINIDALADELVYRTGRWHSIEWLIQFWEAVSGGYGGIPQVSEPSDHVAEAYAESLTRALLRRGLTVWRYADDCVPRTLMGVAM